MKNLLSHGLTTLLKLYMKRITKFGRTHESCRDNIGRSPSTRVSIGFILLIGEPGGRMLCPGKGTSMQDLILSQNDQPYVYSDKGLLDWNPIFCFWNTQYWRAHPHSHQGYWNLPWEFHNQNVEWVRHPYGVGEYPQWGYHLPPSNLGDSLFICFIIIIREKHLHEKLLQFESLRELC